MDDTDRTIPLVTPVGDTLHNPITASAVNRDLMLATDQLTDLVADYVWPLTDCE